VGVDELAPRRLGEKLGAELAGHRGVQPSMSMAWLAT